MSSAPLTVSQLNNYIKGVFEDELILQNIRVEGEVSECSVSAGNVFFTIKDESSILRCVMFGFSKLPKVGERVSVFGSVTFYAKGARMSFTVRSFEPFGEGELYRDFSLLKKRLAAEGLFDNKKKLPSFVGKLAIVTSGAGAVIHDILSVLERRHDYIEVVLIDARVQGDGAADSIFKGIKSAEQSAADIIIIARGGGSDSDLSAFNTEVVARAVAACMVPTISSVGHETDYTLCDFCADSRAGTPSIAAELVSRINDEFWDEYFSCAAKLKSVAEAIYAYKADALQSEVVGLDRRTVDLIYRNGATLTACARRLSGAVENSVTKNRACVVELLNRLSDRTERKIIQGENAVNMLAVKLDSVSPLKLMARGYSKAYAGGNALGSVKSVKVGDEFELLLRDGVIKAEVLSIKGAEKGVAYELRKKSGKSS